VTFVDPDNTKFITVKWVDGYTVVGPPKIVYDPKKNEMYVVPGEITRFDSYGKKVVRVSENA